MAITLTDLADHYEAVLARLPEIAERYPGAHVVRNVIGNLAIVSVDGEFVGWIDVLTGEVETL